MKHVALKSTLYSKLSISNFVFFYQIFLTESFSVFGTSFGILGSLFTCLYAIYNKKVLPTVDQNVWLLSYYNNIYATVLFAFITIINGEIAVLTRYEKIFTPSSISMLIVGGICGFLINVFTSLQIKVSRCQFIFLFLRIA